MNYAGRGCVPMWLNGSDEFDFDVSFHYVSAMCASNVLAEVCK